MIAGCIAVAGAIFLLRRQGLAGEEDIQQINSDEKYILIDVRTPHEFQGGHVKGAKNIPVNAITKDITQVASDKAQMILLYCHSGARSGMARRMLKQHGYTQVLNLGSYSRASRMMKRFEIAGD
ncbi:MAG: rhodanese-like domain-containing protein [Kiritimatiellae bacterium]|nr:rhodanese-like domain-containing protein [Kiritimatiellia bacterium]